MQRRAILATGLAALAAPVVHAQGAWPSRPLRLIIPYTPGGATDAMARLAAQTLGEGLGQPWWWRTGPAAMASSAPRRCSGPGRWLYHPRLRLDPCAPALGAEGAGLRPAGGFPARRPHRPGARHAGDGPQAAAAQPPRGGRRRQGKPPRLELRHLLPGASGHLAAGGFNQATGAGIEIIPYRGTAPALVDVQAGNIQLLFDSAAALLPTARSGNVRALAITARDRSALAPDVPTAIEQGLPGLNSPAGTASGPPAAWRGSRWSG